MKKRLCDKIPQYDIIFNLPQRCIGANVSTALVSLVVILLPNYARAVNIYDGMNDGNALQVNLTTTLSYTAFERVNNPSSTLIGLANANGSEGDLNFQHGIVGNELDAVPVLDIKDGDFGAHFSGDLYLNTVYLQNNQNDQPQTFNPLSTTNNRAFTTATRNIDGQYARVLDAFVSGRHTFGDDEQVSLKVGRETLLWGQSLFFTNNSIAGGQAPIDIITAQNLPNPQAQQVFLPVGQVVATYRPGVYGLTFQAYYQFEEMHDLFQGVGSYFSATDVLDKGGQRVIVGDGEYFLRIGDLKPPSENGQFGASVQETIGNYDFGLYALRFDAKAPEIYAYPGQGLGTATPGGISVGNYRLVYPRDIQLYGASVSTTVGAVNIAGEVSGRVNQPLVPSGFGISNPANPGNASTNPLYPVGDTMNAQVSAIYVSPALPFIPGGVSVDGEAEFNHVISVTANRDALAPSRDASAAAFEFVLTPTYYDVIPGLMVGFPIGLTYNVLGRSELDQTEQHSTGAFSIGVTGTYKNTWIAGLTYKDFLGKPDATYNGLADRGYISFNLQRSF